MRKFTFLFFFILLPIISLKAQIKKQYFDGPYIFHQNDSLRVQWVEAGQGYDTLFASSELGIFERNSLPKVDLKNLDFEKNKKCIYLASGQG